MWSARDSSDGQRQGKAPEISNFAQTCNLLSQYIKEKGNLRDLNLEIGGKVESLEALVKPGSSLAASASPTINSATNSGKSAHPSSEKQSSVDSRTDSSIIMVEDASNKASTSKEGTTRDPKTAQLTIFYLGRVLVFDEYPADKVRELVSIAKRESSQMSYGIMPNTVQEKPNTAPSTSSAREGLPPRPLAASGKQPVGISSNACQQKTSTTTSGAAPSSSKAQEQLSPQSEGTGSDLPIARRSSLHRFLEKRKDRAAVRGPYHNQENHLPISKGDEQLDLNIFPQKD